MREANFSELIGKTLTEVEGFSTDSGEIYFTCSDGKKYKMYHCRNCCESVYIESIDGDVNDLIGHPILLASEEENHENPPELEEEDRSDSFTWTFYKLSTIKGSVTIRWYGASNGYYSESVDFEEVDSVIAKRNIEWFILKGIR